MNEAVKTVVCYGDSNTWGAVPVSSWEKVSRYNKDERWTGILAEQIGSDFDVISEGLPARTTVLVDPVDGDHFSGLSYLLPCLLSHRPIHFVIMMLGTNDLKRRFNVSAEEVAAGVGRLLSLIKASECLAGEMADVLVVAPPPIQTIGVFREMYENAPAKSRLLSTMIEPVTRAYGTSFLDAGLFVRSSPVDGIHLEVEDHRKLGLAVGVWLLDRSKKHRS